MTILVPIGQEDNVWFGGNDDAVTGGDNTEASGEIIGPDLGFVHSTVAIGIP